MNVKTSNSKSKRPSSFFFNTHKKEAMASKGMIVINHPLASAAGVEMLARGGNAFDTVCQALINVIDFGMSIQQAVEAPCIWTMGIAGAPGETLQVEPGFPEETLKGLSKRGHEVVVVSKIAGGMNGILVDPITGLMRDAACWRADRTPMGVSGGPAHPKALRARV